MPKPALRIAAGVLAIALALGLLYFGAQPYASQLIPAPWDKLAHLAYSACLTLLVWISLGARRAALALLAALALALLDEIRQSGLPGRESDVFDFSAGAAGAALTCVIVWAGRTRPFQARREENHDN